MPNYGVHMRLVHFVHRAENCNKKSSGKLHRIRRALRQFVISSFQAQLYVLEDHGVADGRHIDVMLSLLATFARGQMLLNLTTFKPGRRVTNLCPWILCESRMREKYDVGK